VRHAWLLALVADPDELVAEVQRVDQGFVAAQRAVAFKEVVPGEVHVLVVDHHSRAQKIGNCGAAH
jgi:hypothetical protein